MGHETYGRAPALKLGSDRSFGVVFAVAFALIGLWPLMAGREVRAWSLALASGFLLLAAVRPGMLAPLNRLWMRFGALLHRVMNPLILGVIFFLVVTPTGLLMRALGKDLLRLRRDAAAPTYWVPREPPGPPADSLKDPF